MLTHGNLLAMCDSVVEAFEIVPDDHCLLVLPLFHANAIVLSTLTPLLVGGAHTTIAAKFSVDTFFDMVERYRPTYFSAFPRSTRCSMRSMRASRRICPRSASRSVVRPRCRPS